MKNLIAKLLFQLYLSSFNWLVEPGEVSRLGFDKSIWRMAETEKFVWLINKKSEESKDEGVRYKEDDSYYTIES